MHFRHASAHSTELIEDPVYEQIVALLWRKDRNQMVEGALLWLLKWAIQSLTSLKSCGLLFHSIQSQIHLSTTRFKRLRPHTSQPQLIEELTDCHPLLKWLSYQLPSGLPPDFMMRKLFILILTSL